MDESSVTLQIVFSLGQGRLGRRRLAGCTGLSEMEVRLELERLRGLGDVNLRRSGAELAQAGRARFAPLFERLHSVFELELVSLQLDAVALAALLSVEERSPAWAFRDQAVREGATGLVLLRFGKEGWSFTHNDEPIGAHNPQDEAVINAAAHRAGRGDRLVIAFGPDRRRTGLGLWRVIQGMVGDG